MIPGLQDLRIMGSPGSQDCRIWGSQGIRISGLEETLGNPLGSQDCSFPGSQDCQNTSGGRSAKWKIVLSKIF
jgi:hypothetical protein